MHSTQVARNKEGNALGQEQVRRFRKEDRQPESKFAGRRGKVGKQAEELGPIIIHVVWV